MPSPRELPPTLADLARRNALELSDARWTYDVDRLASAADRVLGLGGRRSTAPEHSEGGERAGEPGRASPPTNHMAPDVPVDDRARPAMRSWMRRHRRLVIGAPLVAALVGVVAAVVASGGDDGGSSESPFPASVEERCVQAEKFWMSNYRAINQNQCRLPPSVISKAVTYGVLTYGVFRNASQAQEFVEDQSQRADDKGWDDCPPKEKVRLNAQYRDGNAECYKNAEGIFIYWSYPDSAIGVQLYLESESIDAAVAAAITLDEKR